MSKQGMGCPVQLRDRDDIAAGIGKIYKSEMQGSLSGANSEGADTALEFSDALFKNGACRICDPAVAITLNLQIKQRSAVIGTVECVGYGLVYRNSYSPGGWIWLIAAMDCN